MYFHWAPWPLRHANSPPDLLYVVKGFEEGSECNASVKRNWDHASHYKANL